MRYRTIDVQRGDRVQEQRRDRGADDAAEVLQPRDAMGDGGCGASDRDGERDHDRRVPEREEESDRDGTLVLLHQLAGRVVDRGDVVRVDRVP